MLVLTRKLGETICIGDDIKIRVVQIKGKQIRIGVVAPDDLTIHREEVYEEIQREKAQKSRNAGTDS